MEKLGYYTWHSIHDFRAFKQSIEKILPLERTVFLSSLPLVNSVRNCKPNLNISKISVAKPCERHIPQVFYSTQKRI